MYYIHMYITCISNAYNKSQGGNIAALTIIENPQLFAGAVFSAPAIVNKASYIQVCYSLSAQTNFTYLTSRNYYTYLLFIAMK